MSSDDNHWRAHMTPTARNICTCAVFATTSFNFGLPTYFVSHGYCYGRVLYAVFYRRAELFDCGVSNDMSKVTHLLVCIVLTPCFCFAGSVCFGSFCLASSETGVAFLQEDYCTHQFAWVFLFSWDRCLRLSFSLLTLFVIWHSGTTWFKYIDAHAKRPLTISCVLYAAME